MLLGRSLQPRRVMPAATAPEDTSTTSTPLSRNATICLTQTAMAWRSSPLPFPVSNALPILITHRRAAVTLSRMQSQLRSANVDNFRTILVILVVEVIVFVVADAGLAPRLAVIQLLDVGARFFFDTPVEFGHLGGIFLVLLHAQFALVQPVHHGLGQLVRTLTFGCRDNEYRTFPLQTLDHVVEDRLLLVFQQLVTLVEYQPALALGQGRTELAQLVNDGFDSLDRIALVQRRHVHQVQQQTGARQVLEKSCAQTRTFGRTGNDTGDVGNDETAHLAHVHHTQVGHHGGEGVVRHLGLGGRYSADESALAGIGQTQQPHVRQHLELQFQVAQFTQAALGGLARSTVHTGLEAGIAQTMESALGHQQPLTGLGQVTDDLLGSGIHHSGTHRNAQHHVLALGAGAIGAATVLAPLGVEPAGIAVVDQGVEVGIGFQIDGAAITTITTVRTALGNELLPAETHATIATITGFDGNGHFIYEFHIAPPHEGLEGKTYATNKKAPSQDRAFWIRFGFSRLRHSRSDG